MMMFPKTVESWMLRGKSVRNRVVHAPMSVCYADENGRATRAMAEHYGRRAMGGAGIVITENVAVSRVGRQMPKQPMLADCDAIDGYREVCREIKRHGALAIMQIVHAGRYAGPWDVYERDRRLCPSAVPFALTPDRAVTPQEITEQEIERCIDEFVTTAMLAEEAGWDGVELHGAQGFLISSFLSPRMNRRTDAWGGAFENRVRFALEVARSVRRAVSSEFILGMQLMSDELAPGGWTLPEAVRLAALLQEVDLDFVLPVVSTFETMKSPQNIQRMREPMFQHRETTAIKAATSMMVFANGRIDTPERVEHVLAAAEADAVAMARALFADPDWVLKLAAGREREIRSCGCPNSLCLRTQLTGSLCECWPQQAKSAGFLGYDGVHANVAVSGAPEKHSAI